MSASLSQSDLRFVLLALFSVGINTVAKAWRWQILLGEPGKQVPRRATLNALLVGQMINTLYPVRLGELSRAYAIGGLGPGRAFTLGGILVEKLLDLCCYSFLVILLITLVVPGKMRGAGSISLLWNSQLSIGIGIVIAVGLISVLLLFIRPETFLRAFKRIVNLIPQRLRPHAIQRMENGAASFSVLAKPREVTGLAIWSVVIWITAYLNNVFVLLALSLYLPWTAALIILVFLQAGVSLPSVPGKIGVFEYACVLALIPFQVNATQALGFGILLHAIVLLPTTLVGAILFFRQGLDIKSVRSLESQ